jgi:MFS family permease
MNNRVGIRKWLSFIIAGFVGQLAWAIENNFFNLYVFECTENYNFIPAMVAASAAAATLTTLLMGALSDRLGKRKAFISFGYILWGISIILFAFLDPHSNLSIVAGSAMAAGTMIVVMDCVMTFFGSTANDAAFNAYVTDNTQESNRGKVESVLSILPLIAMIAVVGLDGALTAEGKRNWLVFFLVIGGLTTIVGIISIFLLPKDTVQPNKTEPYIKNIFYGFRPKVIKNNPLLYLVLITFMVFSIGIQVFMPYLMVYIDQVLEIKELNFTITLGVTLILASAITVVFGLFMDKIGKNKIMIPAIIVTVAGAIGMFFVQKNFAMGGVMIAGTIMMSGYMIGTAVLGAKVRDFTPENEVGLFQGVRMIFIVLIPMVTGPYIGRGVSYINAQTYVNEYNQTVIQPNSFIFLFAGLVILLAIIPTLIIIKKERQIKANEQIDETAD